MTRPIIALDFSDQEAMTHFLRLFPTHEKLYLKVGMELFYQIGINGVQTLIDAGHDVFLDLKLHDIPHTVARSVQLLSGLGIRLLNVHALGGVKMMQAAKAGLMANGPATALPKLIAVTQLTSTSEMQLKSEQLVAASMMQSVSHLASLAQQAGLDGVVCSALEVKTIKQVTNTDFICVTPGIRLAQTTSDDQQRIVTPQQAAELGSNRIVVGRPITQAADPYRAYQQIKYLWEAKNVTR